MHSLTVIGALDRPARAAVDDLLRTVEEATGHPALADAKVVALHSGGGFVVLARDGARLVAAGVGVQPDPERPVWNIQDATTAARSETAARLVEEVWARGGARVQWWANDAGPDDDALAARLGLTPWRDVVQLRRPLPHPEAPELPEGVRLRAFAPGADDEAWLDVNRRAFADHPEQGAFGPLDLAGRMAEPWFQPADFLIADDADGMAGFCWVKLPDATHGEIYVIGVHPRAQGTGLGRALVLAGLARMAERGAPEARLYTDGANAKALTLYDGLGFRRHHVDRAYAAERP